MSNLPLLLTLALSLGAPAHADGGTPRDTIETVGYDVSVETQSFEVLEIDFDAELAFFRHVYQLVPDKELDAGPGVNCGYADLPPGYGEVLGVYDLGADSYRMLWTVAPPVRELELCAKASEVASARKDAKAAAADFGFGKGKTPARVTPGSDGTFLMPLSREGSAATLEARWGSHPEDDGGSIAFVELRAGEKSVYTRRQRVSTGRAATVTIHALFVDDGRAVLLESVTSLADGKAARTLYSLSPVVDVEAVVLGESPRARKEPTSEKSATPPPDPKAKGALPDADADADNSCVEDTCVCGACLCGGPAAVTGILGVLGCAACGEVCSPLGWLFDKIIPDDFNDDEHHDEGDGEPEPPPPEPGQAPDQFARAMSSRTMSY